MTNGSRWEPCLPSFRVIYLNVSDLHTESRALPPSALPPPPTLPPLLSFPSPTLPNSEGAACPRATTLKP